MKAALIQLNPKVGDIGGNVRKILRAVLRAADLGAELAIAPELAVTGYPPRDLLLYPGFAREAEKAAETLAREIESTGVTVIAGSVGRNHGKGRPLFNRALVLEKGTIARSYAKRLLPTYDVFDEARYFEPGKNHLVFKIGGLLAAVTVCEDIWNDEAFWPRPHYELDPLEDHPPFDLLVNISASPFSVGKQALREEMLKALARKHSAQVLYVNQVGANDEIIFDGRSSHFGADGGLLSRARAFEEDVLVVDLDNPQGSTAPDDFSPESETHRALELGVRDYCHKNGISTVVLGLSGGIDSAVTAVVAKGAVGADNVHGLIMPSPYSSAHSVKDAADLARNLEISLLDEIEIREAMAAFAKMLKPVFKDLPPDSAEENIQARIRGILLMGVANKFGRMLLTTGNKSEISVGYCTIYGDMCGALAVIGDLYKTEVFNLARFLNQDGILIPENTLSKPPSAELKPGQTDQDNLPPYELLDAILKELLEKRLTPDELVQSGRFGEETVRQVSRLVKAAEFKRRQAAPVLKITSQAFGVGWRMPVAARSVFGN
ncbi:MAG: NAD+ synthase [Deltaproteobacteria bacterium]|jgi:NAD+ synthetase|nr:NAD+ synthase [Deltaproteobacteria bacterium]